MKYLYLKVELDVCKPTKIKETKKKFYIGCENGDIIIWDKKKDELIYRITGFHNTPITYIELYSGYFVTQDSNLICITDENFDTVYSTSEYDYIQLIYQNCFLIVKSIDTNHEHCECTECMEPLKQYFLFDGKNLQVREKLFETKNIIDIAGVVGLRVYFDNGLNFNFGAYI